MQPSRLTASFLCAVALAGPACASGPAGQQLIVKFRPSTLTCDQRGVAELATLSRLPLSVVRPMSGDACVVLLHPAKSLGQALARLQAVPAVEWAEADAPAKAQPR